MPCSGVTEPAQLSRQVGWLSEHWLWLLDTKVLPSVPGRPTALDVGCGPGVVAQLLSSRMDVMGLDADWTMVQAARGRAVEGVRGDAHLLPFKDGSFDVVLCSFLILWLDDPVTALKEMCRVSRGWVVCLAEPDHGGRIDHPEELRPLHQLIVEGMRAEGGDPLAGRKLNAYFTRCGLEPEVGVSPGVWSIGRLREESEREWEWVVRTVGTRPELPRLKDEWDRSLAEGTMFQFNPIFYALARKR